MTNGHYFFLKCSCFSYYSQMLDNLLLNISAKRWVFFIEIWKLDCVLAVLHMLCCDIFLKVGFQFCYHAKKKKKKKPTTHWFPYDFYKQIHPKFYYGGA